jgi:hypothetical protein
MSSVERALVMKLNLKFERQCLSEKRVLFLYIYVIILKILQDTCDSVNSLKPNLSEQQETLLRNFDWWYRNHRCEAVP